MAPRPAQPHLTWAPGPAGKLWPWHARAQGPLLCQEKGLCVYQGQRVFPGACWGACENLRGWRGVFPLCMWIWGADGCCLQAAMLVAEDVCLRATVGLSSFLAPLACTQLFARACTFLACCTSLCFHSRGGIILTGKCTHWGVLMQLVYHLEVQHQRGTVRAACREVHTKKDVYRWKGT